MKKLFILILICASSYSQILFNYPAPVTSTTNTWAYKQGTGAALASAGSTTVALAYASNNTAGSLLICGVTYDHSPDVTVTVADGSNGAWTEMTSCAQYQSTTTQGLRCFYKVNGAYTTKLTVTATFSSSSTYRGLVIDEWTGQKASPLEKQTSAQGTSGSPASGAVTTIADGQLIWSVEMDIDANNTVTAGGIFTKRVDRSGDSSGGMCTESGTQTTHGSQNSSWTYGTTTHHWECAIATFQIGP